MEEWPVIPRVKYPLADNGNFCIVKATGVAHICADAGQAGAGILVFRCTHVDGSPFLPEPPHHAYMVDVVMGEQKRSFLRPQTEGVKYMLKKSQ